MTITASLHSNSRRWRVRQIGCHNRGGATIKGERTLHHPSVSDWEEVWNAVPAGLNQQFHRILAISRRIPCRMRSPGTFVPQSLACCFALFPRKQFVRRSCALHVFITYTPKDCTRCHTKSATVATKRFSVLASNEVFAKMARQVGLPLSSK